MPPGPRRAPGHPGRSSTPGQYWVDLPATSMCLRTHARAPRDVTDMSRRRSSELTPELVERLAQRDVRGRLGVVLPFVTLDAEGRPHPMVLSYLEIRAYDARTLGLVIQAASGSASNLVQRGVGTLLVVEPDAVAYVKTRLLDGPFPVAGGEEAGLGYFLLEVEEVLEDSATDWEAGMRITGSAQYAPAPTLEEPWARATLDALATPRARA